MLRVKVLYFKGLKISHKISRLLQIAIALSLLVGLIQLWESSLLQGQSLLKSQTQKMARLLVQQTAYSAAPALQLQNDEQLQWLANALVEDPKVVSAAIFSDQGIRLSFAQSLTNEEFGADPDAEEMSLLLSKYPPYVEPVIQEGKNLGYVEVRLDTKLFFNEIKEAHNLNMEQQQMMLLIAGLIGMLLSRALSFKRADFDRRRTRAKLRKNPKKEKSSAALAAVDKPEITDNPATAKADMKDKPQTTTETLAATTKPKVKMVHQAHTQSKTGPTQPSDLDSDATG
ncbi:MAG: YtjB family periplasmic protein [Shewanella sp.]|uniref:YtjB family periplasmic protein n=1 Tax=Shewanella sp. TaxID=50422 RepID=UPI003F3FCB5B